MESREQELYHERTTADMVALHAQLLAVQQTQARLESTLDAMRQSTSWRITAPMRQIFSAFRRLQHFLKRRDARVDMAPGSSPPVTRACGVAETELAKGYGPTPVEEMYIQQRLRARSSVK